MKDTGFYAALIREIEKIYNRIYLIILRKRMAGYHKQPLQSSQPYADGIKSPLLDCIDNIIADHQADSTALHDNDRPTHDGATNTNRYTNKYTDKTHVINDGNAEELTRHIKATANESELYPEIAQKLEHSVWEHIHATIRYARQGDKSKAAMHTDIANSACKELAHHMTKDRYQALTMKIEKYLGTLKSS